MILSYSQILAPIIGGFIGYITNDIAIRMLFRPHQAKYMFGFQIPFTPGLIPKEKGRLAESIGNVISINLLNKDSLEKYLLSDEMIAKLNSAVHDFIDSQKKNPEKLLSFLEHYLSEDEINHLVEGVEDNLSDQVYSSLTSSSLGSQIAKSAMDQVSKKLGADGVSEILAGVGGLLKGISGVATALLGKSLIEKIFSWIRIPIENYLETNINEMLKNDGMQISNNLISAGVNKFINTPVSELLDGKDEQLNQLETAIESIYRKVITEHLPKILQSIDICTIVKNRINEMDVAETETLVMQVMNKELKAIVWLGALLGFLMGSINLLI